MDETPNAQLIHGTQRASGNGRARLLCGTGCLQTASHNVPFLQSAILVMSVALKALSEPHGVQRRFDWRAQSDAISVTQKYEDGTYMTLILRNQFL